MFYAVDCKYEYGYARTSLKLHQKRQKRFKNHVSIHPYFYFIVSLHCFLISKLGSLLQASIYQFTNWV